MIAQKLYRRLQPLTEDQVRLRGPARHGEVAILPFEVLGQSYRQRHRKRGDPVCNSALFSEVNLVDDLGVA